MNTVLKTNCKLVDALTQSEITCHLRKWSRIAAETTRFLSTKRSTSNHDNYYEILGVERKSTTKDIKKAFFRLSKEFHPDRNPSDSSLNARFIKLNEAYSVLGRPSLRLDYDRSLDHGNEAVSYHTPFRHRTDATTDSSTYRPDDGLWENRDRSRDRYYEGKPYYGIKGLSRLPNWWIAVGCCVFVVFGVCSHYVAISITNRITNDALDKMNRTHLSSYLMARNRAKERDIDGQLRWLKSIMDNEDPESDEKRIARAKESE